MAADPLTAGAIDELLNYDSSDGDPFADNPITNTRDDKPTLSPRGMKRRADDGEKENFGLGLDEEVKITKKRQPTVKLDEARLLSRPGIPKLRELARSGNFKRKLRLKGKGHEFADVARILNHYQLWLDNLYPRAKFADGLQLIEKVGHSKRMQVMRREWIDEGKPGYIRKQDFVRTVQQEEENADPSAHSLADDGDTSLIAMEEPRASILGTGSNADSLFIPDPTERNDTNQGEPDEDELDALLTERNTNTAKNQTTTNMVDSEGEDDLDALLAEAESRKIQHHKSNIIEDNEDYLEALLAEREASVKPTITTASKRPNTIFYDDDSEGESDIDLLLPVNKTRKDHIEEPAVAEVDLNTANPAPSTTQETGEGENVFTSSPLLNNVDELDEILDEHDARKAKEGEKMAHDLDTAKNDTQNSIPEVQDVMFSSSPLPNDGSFEER